MMCQKSCSLFVTCFALLLGACSAPSYDAPVECDPNAAFPYARCLALQADAGPDGDGGAGGAAGNGGAGGTATAKPADFENPGLTPDTWAPCGDGFCAPEPSGPKAIGWDKVPVSLYVGPNDGTPLACPDKLKEVGIFYDDLVAPPASCEACTCEASKGDCSEPPTKIEIRAGTCAESGVPFSPFDGPPNWTGTCSSDGGLSAGAMCGNEPCAQSVWASPLPAPKNDACMPTTTIPLSKTEYMWKTHAIACETTTPPNACVSETQYCAANLGPEWLTCVHKDGLYDLNDCPDEYKASVHRLYPEKPIDDRGCTECACGAPKGGATGDTAKAVTFCCTKPGPAAPPPPPSEPPH